MPTKIIKLFGIRNIKIFLFFSFLALLQLIFYLYFYDFLSLNIYKKNIVLGFYCYSFFTIEFYVVSLINIWLYRKNVFLKASCIFINIIVFVNCSFQLLSFYYSNSFINSDLMIQASNINLLITPFSISILLIPILIYFIFIIFFLRKNITPTFKQNLCSSFLIAFLIILNLLTLYSDKKYSQIVTRTQRLLNINQNSPTLSLIKETGKIIFPKRSKLKIDANDIALGKQYGFIFKPEKKYPFINKTTYTVNQDSICLEQVRPNLIVFFGESLSALKLGCYNPTYKNITPNIDSFAKDSLVIHNYYNHVSPTVRGIIGQLCSTYPEYGYHIWKSLKLKTPPACSLPQLLKAQGYTNTYFSASAPEVTYLEEQLKSIGYTKTFFSNKIGKEFLNGEKGLLPSDDYSDHQMIRSLIKFMKKTKATDQPFFITVSNMETHVDMNITTDGKPYKDGTNPVLNTTYNFDHAFGKFWKYFKSSKFYKNTIVILTADHAHFPSVRFTETAGNNYQKLYCDKIAFIIYNPFSNQKGTFDAYTTSIDFAPTVVQVLNLQSKENSFLGHSIFKDRRKYKSGIGIFRDKLFTIEKDKAEAHNLDNKAPATIKSLYKLIRYSQQIQNDKRLWYN